MMICRAACLLPLIASLAFAQASSKDKVDVRVELPADPVRPGASFDAKVHFGISEGWHIYGPEEKESIPTKVELSPSKGFEAGKAQYPELREEDIPALGGKVFVYEKEAVVRIPIAVAADVAVGDHALVFKVDYMACKTVCLRPVHGEEVEGRLRVEGSPVEGATKTDGKQPAQATPPATAPKGTGAGEQHGLWYYILAGLGAGLAICITPCIYPMIPITLSVFGGAVGGGSSFGGKVAGAIAYFLGIAVFYAILGLIAAAYAVNLGAGLGNPWVVGGICVVFFALALSMFGLYEIRLPSGVQAGLAGGQATGVVSIFFLGCVLSLVAAPCAGPFVGGMLTLAGTSGSRLAAYAGLQAVGVGLGLPFVFLAIFANALHGLPKAGEWMVKVKVFFGFVMLAMILYYARVFMSERTLFLLAGILCVFWGTFTGAFTSLSADAKPGSKFGKALGLVIALAGIGLLARGFFYEELDRLGRDGTGKANQVGIHWRADLEKAREDAKAQKRPMIVDFTAEW